MTESWWRSWHGAPMDHKWSVVATRSGVKPGIVSAIAWALIDFASQHEDRGDVSEFDVEVYSIYSGFSDVEIKAVIQAMIDKRIIVDGRLANWEKRQPVREDDSAERVRRFREKKRSVTQCNAREEVDSEKRREESDTDKSREEQSRVEDAQTNETPPEAPPAAPLTGSEPAFIPQTIEERIYCAVTNHPTIPSGEIDSVLDRIAKIQRAKNLDPNAAIAYLRPYWQASKKRYPASTKTFWLDWALIGEIPQPKARSPAQKGSRPTSRASPPGFDLQIARDLGMTEAEIAQRKAELGLKEPIPP